MKNEVTRLACLSGATLLVFGSVTALQAQTRTWGFGSNGALTSGSQLWDVPGNWSGDDVPNVGGSGEVAQINDVTTGNRTITTPSTATNIARLLWTHQSGSTGVSKLVLGNNLTAGPNLGNSTITNDRTAADLVIDLAGFKMSSYGSLEDDLTLINSGGSGGIYESGAAIFTTTNSIIGANVTIRHTSTNGAILRGTFDPTSLNIFTATQSSVIVNTLGKLQIGESGGPTVTQNFNASSPDYDVRSDVTIYAAAASTAANFTLYPNPVFVVTVGGNFIDHGAANAAGYRDGTLVFYGSPATPRTVSIARSLTNDFRFGDNGPDRGGLPGNVASYTNIILANDLTTADVTFVNPETAVDPVTGSVTIRSGSTVNLDTFTLTARQITGESGITLGYTFGADPGLVVSTTTASLGGGNPVLNLILNYDGTGWVNGSSLVLIDYASASFSGANMPTLGTVTAPAYITYGSLFNDTGSGQLVLTNVVVPEPASGLGLAVLSILALRRGRNHRGRVPTERR